ncbi:MAG TPA: hypothetical protein VME70_14495 [Mycobacteriales bacterium]|nr:hypothetical protein [Mycobacteriales bacterium]
MSSLACFVLAGAAIIAAIALFGTGFAGPAPIALAAAGGLIAAGVALWRPSAADRGRGRYPGT